MRRVAGAVVAAVLLLTLGVGSAVGAAVAGRSVGAAVKAASRAQSPFRGLTATTVHVGGSARQVVIAKTEAQRQRGLRQRSNLGHYDGMLFVFSATTNVGFTMSTVPVPLDIGFYRSDGRLVDTLRMLPCTGTDATCPAYRARASFRYTLETPGGALPPGNLTG
ncbi:MAG TPA: DUF192 domain-containing protein [Acidimicrobiia bacterium]|nr:DUF192 domain-containing protein [Acidimicrobiia bacterium]